MANHMADAVKKMNDIYSKLGNKQADYLSMDTGNTAPGYPLVSYGPHGFSIRAVLIATHTLTGV